jgi:potassium-transporting ATPase ATP-binding subunit
MATNPIFPPACISGFDQLRAIGIRTVMITGDNPLTAAAIAREAGVETNDAPALAQADVGVAMNTGTQAAKEAGNMVDLDSNSTKLIEVVEIIQ